MSCKSVLLFLPSLFSEMILQAQSAPCDPPLTASISVSGPVCAGESFLVTFNLPNDDDGDFNVTYSVGNQTFNILNISGGHTVSHIVSAPLSVTLQLVEYNEDDDDACFTVFNQNVPVNVSNPTLNIASQTEPACGQSNGNFSVSATGGVAPYTYSLDGGAGQPGNTFSGLGAGVYLVEVRDAAACTAQIAVTLSASDGPSLNVVAQNNPSCGQSDGSISVSASGGTSPYQYSLDGANFQGSPVFSNLPAGNYQIFVKDAASCIGNAVATLSDPGAGLPQANISSNNTTGCPDDVFVLNANLPPGTNGVWSSDRLTPATPSNPVWATGVLPPGATSFTWTLSAPSCPMYDAISLTINVLSAPLAADDGVFTSNESATVEADVSINDATPGPVTYRILKNTAQGDAYFDGQNRLVYEPLPNASGADTAVYEICLIECPNACDTALVLFRNVRSDDPCVITGDTSNVFTNGLTPNGDGANDRLFFQAVSITDCSVNYAKSEIIIYNRWGDIVFEASPYNNDWEGKNEHGRDLPPGVYYFVLRVTLDKVYTQFGSVILIR